MTHAARNNKKSARVFGLRKTKRQWNAIVGHFWHFVAALHLEFMIYVGECGVRCVNIEGIV